MERRDLTKADLIKKTGLPRGRVYSWFEADRNSIPNAHDAVEIANSLGVSVEYLALGTDQSDPWIREHADFLRDCKALGEVQLKTIKTTVKIMADEARITLDQARKTGGNSDRSAG